MNGNLAIGGVFEIVCRGADGRIKWRDTAKNAFTTEGLNHVLDVAVHGTTPVSPWYIGLIADGSYSALAAGDTLASHAGWTEADVISGNRLEWTEGAAAGGVTTNSSTVDHTIDASDTVKGAFLCSVASGTSGVLLCTALFSQGDRAVVSGDTLQVTYTLTASAA